MRMEEAFYNISMYLYNKNVLEYARIARNETESKIPYIEGCSTIYGIMGVIFYTDIILNVISYWTSIAIQSPRKSIVLTFFLKINIFKNIFENIELLQKYFENIELSSNKIRISWT